MSKEPFSPYVRSFSDRFVIAIAKPHIGSRNQKYPPFPKWSRCVQVPAPASAPCTRPCARRSRFDLSHPKPNGKDRKCHGSDISLIPTKGSLIGILGNVDWSKRGEETREAVRWLLRSLHCSRALKFVNEAYWGTRTNGKIGVKAIYWLRFLGEVA